MTNGAIVTGGATRLGMKISIGLAKAGFDVIVHYNSSEMSFILVNYIKSMFNVKCFAFKGDLTEQRNIHDLISFAFEKVPTCKILINNASVFFKRDIMSTTLDDITLYNNIHILAPFFVSQSFVKQIGNNGFIVNILDEMVRKKSSTSYFSYLFSKKALEILTYMMEEELCVKHIKVKGVYPPEISDDEFCADNSFLLNGKCKEVISDILSHISCF